MDKGEVIAPVPLPACHRRHLKVGICHKVDNSAVCSIQHTTALDSPSNAGKFERIFNALAILDNSVNGSACLLKSHVLDKKSADTAQLL